MFSAFCLVDFNYRKIRLKHVPSTQNVHDKFIRRRSIYKTSVTLLNITKVRITTTVV